MQGQQDGKLETINVQNIWTTEYDRDFSKLLDSSILQQLEDLPRATSAPPHFYERVGSAPADTVGRTSRLPPLDSYTDIRFDEDYAAFYESNMGKRNLPPPIEGNTIYTDISALMASQQYKDFNSFQNARLSNVLNQHHGYFGQTNFGGFEGQLSLGRGGGLETVQEISTTQSQNVHDSVLQALSQLNMGGGGGAAGNGMHTHIRASLEPAESPIQRPGSQPAPNPYEAAIAAGAGHYRSASALPAFNLEGIPNMSQTISSLSTSTPATSQAAVIESLYGGQNQQNNDLMMGSSIDYQVAYQAAYQAALMQQSQNTSQILLGQQPLRVAQKMPGIGGSGLSIDTGMGKHMQNQSLGNGSQVLGGQITSPLHGFNVAQSNTKHSQHITQQDTPTYEKEERGNNGRGKRFNRRNERERDREFAENYYESQYYKYNTLEEVVGQVIQVAQDQNGCRFLQKKFDEGGAEAVAVVFPEIRDNIVSLMKDPFGNYLVQKLLDRCSEEQRTQVVKAVAEKGELVSIALSTHGTRAVQKLIETLTTEEQKQLAIAALKPGVVSLIKDLNGNHVVQRCLHRLGPEDSQFIYNAAIYHCVEIASHRHGCCVLQRCIDFATPDQKKAMIDEIAKNALVLSQDAFGNYVVQYVLDLGIRDAGHAIMLRLLGHYPELSMQKFSSNVVEKCLKIPGLDDTRERIIREVMHSTLLPRLLQDGYGNYVVQSALTVTSGSLHQNLVECIRPYLPTLRGTPHGKRILQKVMASLKDPFNPN